MISVLTLTYKRPHLLEESIESFLRQKVDFPIEMVIINDNMNIPNSSWGEDSYMTFNTNAKIYTSNKINMIYRWGMNTLHISGLGDNTNVIVF